MKSMFQFFAAVACVAALTACGGGSKKAEVVVIVQPEYKMTEVAVGTGTLAEQGDLVTVTYVGYLYDSTKADGKGEKVESSVDAGTTAPPFTIGVGTVRTGWDRTILGMRVGGKRTAVLPANLAYGTQSREAVTTNGIKYAAIVANSPLVYDFELINVTKIASPVTVPAPTTFTIFSETVGTGTVAATAGKTVTVQYIGWLYDGMRENRKGVRFDPAVGATTGYGTLEFTIGTGVIAGFSTGTTGMVVGGKRTVILPPDIAYGATGSGTIPANATLVFDIELMSIK